MNRKYHMEEKPMKSAMAIATVFALTAGMHVSSARAADDDATKEEAVSCPKCETVWVKEPRQIGKIKVFVSKKKMNCAECKTAVENFFATGKLEHACKTCGDLVACEGIQGEKPADAESATHRRD
jgi:hypothetical protein